LTVPSSIKDEHASVILSDRDPVGSFPTVLAEMRDLSIILVAMSRPHRLNVMTMETISDVRKPSTGPKPTDQCGR